MIYGWTFRVRLWTRRVQDDGQIEATTNRERERNMPKKQKTVVTETTPPPATAPRPHVPERLDRVPLGNLRPSPHNPRQIDPKHEQPRTFPARAAKADGKSNPK